MTNLKVLDQLAKELNYFRAENIPSEYLKPQKLGNNVFDYNYKLNQNLPSLPSDVLEKFTHGIYFECQTQKDMNGNIELYYIEHTSLLFLTPNNNIVRLRNNKNKWVFMLDYSYYRKISNIDFNIQSRYLKDLKEPNLIGVFNDKKVMDWFNYLDATKVIQDQMLLDSLDKNSEIEKEIQSTINSLPNCKLYRYNNITEIETNYFVIKYNHDKKSQWLGTEIRFRGSVNDVINITSKINKI